MSRKQAERYLDYLNGVFGVEPKYYPIESRTAGVGGVTCIVYHDIPEPGFITGATYGLSLVDHPDWKLGRPELCIFVQSTDLAWPLAVAEMANNLRGECPFCYGDVISFDMYDVRRSVVAAGDGAA